MIFAGKYRFQSTNKTGTQKYLSSRTTEGQAYPVMSADTAGEVETWILYDNGNGLVLQSGNLDYTGAIDSVGLVVSYPDIAKARSMQISLSGDASTTFQILVDSDWQDIRYTIDEPMPYLVFPIAHHNLQGCSKTALDLVASNSVYTNLTRVTITPSLTKIQATKDARRLDFRNVDLSKVDLQGVDCTGADFTGAILDNTDFTGATLNHAIFRGARMGRTIFIDAKLNGANFRGANLSTAVWGGELEAKEAHFEGCTGVGAFMGSNDPAINPDFTGAYFDGADFSYANFSYAIMDQCHLLRSVFTGAIFQSTSFVAAQLGGVDQSAATNMAFAYLTNVNFKNANLFGVSFTFATVRGAQTNLSQTATLELADFSNAYLEGVNLSGAKLNGSKFSNACLVNVDFTNTNLNPTASGSVVTSLSGAMLQGAKFPQAQLQNADLSNANVAFANGFVDTRYCDAMAGGVVFPPPPGEHLAHHATQSLDLTTMTAETICPNGQTVKANQALGNDLSTMLTSNSLKHQWAPIQCSFMQNALQKTDSRYILESDHVGMPCFSMGNVNAMRKLVADPDICQQFFHHKSLETSMMISAIRWLSKQQRLSQVTYWPAFRRSDKALIGLCGLTLSHLAGAIEINTGVLPEFRGDPLAKEMVGLVIDHAFNTLGLFELHAFVETDNIAGHKFTLKMGFEEAELPEPLSDARLRHYLLKAPWAE